MIDLLLRLRTFTLLFVLLAISSFVMVNANPLTHGKHACRAQTLKIVGAIEYQISWAAEIPCSLRENQQLLDSNLRLTNELNRSRTAERENEDLRGHWDGRIAAMNSRQFPLKSLRVSPTESPITLHWTWGVHRK